jgi:hypothetical protein
MPPAIRSAVSGLVFAVVSESVVHVSLRQEKIIWSSPAVCRSIRMFGQNGAIPATAECLDEQHGIHYAAAEKIFRCDLIGKRGGCPGIRPRS